MKPNRRGLSPLEMVLALPMLLFVMALMIIVGNRVGWKVRALNVARHAAWGSRSPRTGLTDPRPTFWPTDGTNVGVNDAGNLAALDDPRVHQPVARGPLPFGTTVNSDVLDPTLELREGSATLTRLFPLFKKMGAKTLHAQTELLEDKWQFGQMGLSANRQRRIPVLYALAKAPVQLSNAYVQAAMAIWNAPFRPALAPLDNDDEFLGYSAMFGWGSGAPDFHPRLHQFCSLDATVAKEEVEDLIDRIQGRKKPHIPSVAETMAQAFINLYEKVIQELQMLMNGPNPPPGASAQIAQLKAKIKILQKFLSSL